MTENQKAIIRKMRLTGNGYGQIAKVMGLSINTVKSFCRRKGIESNADGHLMICPECGKIEPRQVRRGQPRIFCSKKCALAWHYKHRILTEHNAVKEVCPTCGQTFFSYESAARKYCCRACYMAARFGKRLAYDQGSELS